MEAVGGGFSGKVELVKAVEGTAHTEATQRMYCHRSVDGVYKW